MSKSKKTKNKKTKNKKTKKLHKDKDLFIKSIKKFKKKFKTLKKINVKDLTIDKSKKKYKNRNNLSPKEARKYKKTVDYIYHSGIEKHYKKYNYCGPGTKYWVRKDEPELYEFKMKLAGKKPTGTKPYGKPYNPYDKCCMDHDYSYQVSKTKKDLRDADNKMLACLKNKKDEYKNKQKIKKMNWSTDWLDYVILKNMIKNKVRLDDIGFNPFHQSNKKK